MMVKWTSGSRMARVICSKKFMIFLYIGIVLTCFYRRCRHDENIMKIFSRVHENPKEDNIRNLGRVNEPVAVRDKDDGNIINGGDSRKTDEADDELNIKIGDHKKKNIAKNNRVINTNCPTPEEEDWTSKVIHPKIRLNPNGFLYPVLTNGPNNQLEGLWQSIYLAIRLNRTLVMPEFQTHRVTKSDKPAVDVAQQWRTDLTSIRKFISVVPTEDLHTVCKGKINAVFLTKEATNYRHCSLVSVGRKRNVTIIDPNMEEKCHHSKESTFHKSIHIYPKNAESVVHVKSDTASLNKAYGTSDRCAVFPFPWKTIEVIPYHRSVIHELNFTDVRKVPDDHLYSMIIGRAKLPEFTSQVAQDFIHVFMNDAQIVAVHWRFDPDDWQRTCRKDSQGLRASQCATVAELKSIHISNAIAHKVEVLRKRKNGEREYMVYIAAPPAAIKTVREVKRILLRKWKLTAFNAEDLFHYVKKQYKKCVYDITENNDVLSLIEMQIGIQSEAFMFSLSSSWSNNARLYREYVRYDSDILNATAKFVPSITRT